jgi:hypothetical protein
VTPQPPGSGGTGGAVDAPVAPYDSGAGPSDPTCPSGNHRCDPGGCVASTSPDHCGLSCSACPAVAGGTATCDGTKCGGACPAGTKLCVDKCVPEAAACDGKCPPGANPCGGGLCVDGKSLSACGAACMPCPTSPNGVATCDGDRCALTCNAGYHACGSACAKNDDPLTCGTSCSPCTPPTGGKATCDGTKCGAQCPAGQTLCNGACIGSDKACEGTCPAGKHSCEGNCVSDNDVNSCGMACMPCAVPNSDAKATCTNAKCDFDCNRGHKCNGTCSECCSPSDCPSKGNQTAMCSGGKCSYSCPGQKDCGGVCAGCCPDDTTVCHNVCGQPGSQSCIGGKFGGPCSATDSSCCKPDPCNPGGDKCKLGQIVCNGGPTGQCQQTGVVDCGADKTCKGGTCVLDCAGKKAEGQPCCGGSCNSPLVCNRTADVCEAPCGKLNQACCTDKFLDPNLPTGQEGCTGGTLCDGGKCATCGGAEELCCHTGTLCRGFTECPLLRCRACGDVGKACCHFGGTAPCKPGSTCDDVQGICVAG